LETIPFQLNTEGKVYFQTSTQTLLEVLVQLVKLKKPKLAKDYEKIITSSTNVHEIYDIRQLYLKWQKPTKQRVCKQQVLQFN